MTGQYTFFYLGPFIGDGFDLLKTDLTHYFNSLKNFLRLLSLVLSRQQIDKKIAANYNLFNIPYPHSKV